MYAVAICDEDKLYREIIKQAIMKQYGDENVIEIFEYNFGEELLMDMERRLHDLIFIDIEMHGGNGKETARLIRKRNEDAVIVFFTNSYNLTPDIIKIQPFRYIMKDTDGQELKCELPDIVAKMLKETKVQYVTITGKDFVRRIPIKDILFISIAKHGSDVVLFIGSGNITISCREKVRELYDQLKDQGFEYAHNSYIVNMLNVKNRDKHVIKLKDNSELNISRAKRNKFEKRMLEAFHIRKYDL